MKLFYYKNVAKKNKLLTFTNNFAYWLNTEHVQHERVKYNTAAEYRLLYRRHAQFN
jgi:hypothetical protein